MLISALNKPYQSDVNYILVKKIIIITWSLFSLLNVDCTMYVGMSKMGRTVGLCMHYGQLRIMHDILSHSACMQLK